MSLLGWIFGRARPLRAPADVLLDVDHENGLLFLVLLNFGEEPACEVRVDFDRPLVGLDGETTVSELNVFRHLSLLRPGKELRVVLDSSRSWFQRDTPRRFEATVVWKDRRGIERRALFVHDLMVHADWCEALGHGGGAPT